MKQSKNPADHLCISECSGQLYLSPMVGLHAIRLACTPQAMSPLDPAYVNLASPGHFK